MCIVEFTDHLLPDRDSSTGMGAGLNGNNQWEWEKNGNKTRLNLGLGMGMGVNYWEWEEMGLKKIFPLIFSRNLVARPVWLSLYGDHCVYVGYNTAGSPQSTVVMTETVPHVIGPFVGEMPIQTTCPNCRSSIVTAVSYEIGGYTWLIFAILCIVGSVLHVYFSIVFFG